MKYIFIIIIIFITGCEEDIKFEKIEINPSDTELTDDKIGNSVQSVLNSSNSVFSVQQKIDDELIKIAEANK